MSLIAARSVRFCGVLLIGILGGALSLVGPFAAAHELESPRVTIVQREPRHLSITLRLDELELLRRILAPAANPAEFCLSLSAMPDRPFAEALASARQRFVAGFVLLAADGKPLQLGGWRWSPDELIRARVQELALAAVVGEGEHDHRPADEIGADAVASDDLAGVTLRLPTVIDEAVVVSYRPRQQTYRAGQSPKGLDLQF